MSDILSHATWSMILINLSYGDCDHICLNCVIQHLIKATVNSDLWEPQVVLGRETCSLAPGEAAPNASSLIAGLGEAFGSHRPGSESRGCCTSLWGSPRCGQPASGPKTARTAGGGGQRSAREQRRPAQAANLQPPGSRPASGSAPASCRVESIHPGGLSCHDCANPCGDDSWGVDMFCVILVWKSQWFKFIQVQIGVQGLMDIRFSKERREKTREKRTE
eukprot:XP_022263925.1 uncharacterized protein LOC106557553 [Canis lupus familiaris]